MEYVWLLVIIFIHSAVAQIDDRIIQTFENVRSDLKVTEQCSDSLLLYIQNLNSSDDPWALKMLDATSKIPVGLLFSYNFGEIGAFTQCLDTESKDGQIKGKYCLGVLPLGTTTDNLKLKSDMETFQKQIQTREIARRITNAQPRESSSLGVATWSICLPSNCTNEDMLEILGTLIGSSQAICQTKEDANPPLSGGAIATMVILSIFVFLLVASTACDLYYNSKKTEPPSELLVAFSTYRNGRKLFRISKNSNELSCLNGIRVLSMVWVIIGHIFSVHSDALPILNFADIIAWMDTLRSMAIVSGTLSVDSFFLVGGLLVVYGFIKAKHNGVKFNILKFYFHRYLRLTPPFAATVLVSATLLKYMGSGPQWKAIDTSFQEPCKKYWWSALLYVQNYVNVESWCVGQTWYLNIDMQLYFVSPILLFSLWNYPKIGMALVSACIATFIIVPFYIAYDQQLSGVFSNLYTPTAVATYMHKYYLLTQGRAAPWFMGTLLGYILSVIKFQTNEHFRKPRIGKALLLVLWAVCITILLTCVYGGHSTLRGPDYDRWANAFYIALVRPAWALALAWVIFACVTGYGGPVNWILSLPIYQVLNRFTYSIYLIHLTLLYMISLASKTGVYFDEFQAVYSFWGLTMISFMLSIFWVLAFESPVIIIEKLIFKGSGKIADTVGQKLKHGVSALP